MKVEKLYIRNWKAIEEENLPIEGCNVYVSGPNAVGKTSLLDSIFKILSGKDLPPNMLKSGEKKGEVRIDLGDIIVEVDYNQSNKPSLSVMSADGVSFKSPRTMLNEKVGIIDFDINKFLDKSPREKVKVVKDLIGIDFTDVDEEYEKLYKKRTFTKSKIEDLKATDYPFDKNAIEEINILDLQAQIQEVNNYNKKIEEAVARVESKRKRIKEYESELQELKNKIDRINTSIETLEKEINHDEGFLVINELTPIDEKQKELSDAIDWNKKVQEATEGRKRRDKIKETEAELDTIQGLMDRIDELKRNEIAKAHLPVPGLTFTDEGLFLDGLPFERSQINTAKLTIAGLQLQLAMLKDVRIARFDGSLLDKNSLKYVEDWAKENDLQLFVEFVERESDQLKIEIKQD